MSLSLQQSATAVAVRVPASFAGIGGVEPYVYSVLPNGAGGTINASTGAYLAPSSVQADPRKNYDTVVVTDDNGDTASTQILVGTPLMLFCEVLQREMGLANGRVYLWDQKIFQPSDNDLYIAVSNPMSKPFANTTKMESDGTATQSVNMMATLDIDAISRGPSARDRKEEIILAMNSIYAQQQQEINSFYIGKLPPGTRFLNLSEIDGAAIPYRFRISINIQYMVVKTKAVPYFDTFEEPTIVTNS